MSTFDIRPDAPGLLRAESVNITLTFTRTGPTTGIVSWNIPTPAEGCAVTSNSSTGAIVTTPISGPGSQAYCGMLVVLDTVPASMHKIPKDGQLYNSDPDISSNLFAGDKIHSALVIGAFYNDTTTTSFDVSGLTPNTPYYISGYPMDCQYRYYYQGVHAYSLSYTNRGTHGKSGTQIVILNPATQAIGQLPTDYTGLAPGVLYNFTIQLGVVPPPDQTVPFPEVIFPEGVAPECDVRKPPQYIITVNGTNAQTYANLVNTINIQLALIATNTQGPVPPNTGGYYFDTTTGQLYIWNGSVNVPTPVITSTTAPNTVVIGTYWLNPTTNVLSLWNGSSWVVVYVITYPTDPTMPIANQTYWFDGITAYLWNGNTWCKVTTYDQPIDPSKTITPPPGSYWYDTANTTLYQWDNTLEMWTATIAIQYQDDPNALPINTFWFNQTNNMLYAYGIPSAGWNLQTNVAISETAPATPAPGKFWYNPTSMQLFQRDITNTVWTQLPVISFPVDPTQRQVCDLWWNTTTNQLNVWDSVNNVWVAVSSFYQQANDPTVPPTITNGVAWWNTATNTFYTWQNACFVITPYINWPTDPITTIILGTVWHDTTNGNWYVWGGTSWSQITPISSPQDLTSLIAGTLWYNPTTLGLQMWNGVSWVAVTYSTTSLAPTLGTYWFNTTLNMLEVWNGMQWVTATPPATVELDCYNNLKFTHTKVGSLSFVYLTDGTLFKSLKVPFSIDSPDPGTDGASDIPSYAELGIGTSGDDGLREQLQDSIRRELGYPVVDVELTKEQMDYAVDRAIQEFRERASIAYRRGFFFMTLLNERQKYLLTNKISGMNKIVDILGIYRLTSSFLSSAMGAGVYGQIVLQHLYNMGTFDLLSYHIMGEYTSLMEILFSTRVTYTWNEQTRELFIHHRFPFIEKMVAIECTVERTEQDILADRYVRPWIRRYASAVCRIMLAEIRGKYATLPGAGGGITLNAAELRQYAATEIEACIAEIENYVVDRPEEYGLLTQLTYG